MVVYHGVSGVVALLNNCYTANFLQSFHEKKFGNLSLFCEATTEIRCCIPLNMHYIPYQAYLMITIDKSLNNNKSTAILHTPFSVRTPR